MHWNIYTNNVQKLICFGHSMAAIIMESSELLVVLL
jgi:hypothetical protein